MKFLSIELKNWRSYYGQQRIEFSTDPSRPLTLLFGGNGSGKTALLNAFTWALYGEFTRGFRQPEVLVNNQALAEDERAEASIKVEFEHDGVEWAVHRSTNAARQKGGSWELKITKDKEIKTEADLQKLFPVSLSDLFFVASEALEDAAFLTNEGTDDTSVRLGPAMRSLLGADIYIHALEDIAKAKRESVLRPLKRLRPDVEAERAYKDYLGAEKKLSDLKEQLSNLPLKIQEVREESRKLELEAKHINERQLNDWSEEKEKIENRIKDLERLAGKGDEHFVAMARESHASLVAEATKQALSTLDAAERVGLMPPRIDKSVLETTLDLKKCLLCARHLEADALDHVRGLQEIVGEAQVAVRGVEARTSLRDLMEEAKRDREALQHVVEAQSKSLGLPLPDSGADLRDLALSLRRAIEGASTRVREESAKKKKFLETTSPADVKFGKAVIEKLRVAAMKEQSLRDRKPILNRDIIEWEEKRDQALQSSKKHGERDVQQRHKLRALEVLGEVEHFLEQASRGLEEMSRRDFEKAVNQTYGDLVNKPFEVDVGEDFRLQVRNTKTNSPAPLSQAELVLLFLSVLAAIAYLTPQYQRVVEQGDLLSKVGSIDVRKDEGFPVVLDAVSSVLDSEYEASVIKSLPDLLPQIIVPTSQKSAMHWEKISDRIGRAYVLRHVGPRASEVLLEWGGKDEVYSTNEDVDWDRCEVVEIGLP